MACSAPLWYNNIHFFTNERWTDDWHPFYLCLAKNTGYFYKREYVRHLYVISQVAAAINAVSLYTAVWFFLREVVSVRHDFFHWIDHLLSPFWPCGVFFFFTLVFWRNDTNSNSYCRILSIICTYLCISNCVVPLLHGILCKHPGISNGPECCMSP